MTDTKAEADKGQMNDDSTITNKSKIRLFDVAFIKIFYVLKNTNQLLQFDKLSFFKKCGLIHP
jgi:hypothetical protein